MYVNNSPFTKLLNPCFYSINKKTSQGKNTQFQYYRFDESYSHDTFFFSFSRKQRIPMMMWIQLTCDCSAI